MPTAIRIEIDCDGEYCGACELCDHTRQYCEGFLAWLDREDEEDEDSLLKRDAECIDAEIWEDDEDELP